MRYLVCTTITALALAACGGSKGAEPPAPAAAAAPSSGSEPAAGGEGTASESDAADSSSSGANGASAEGTNRAEFVARKSDPNAKEDEGKQPETHIKGNATHAAMKIIVVDKEKGPIRGIIIS